MPFGLEYGAPPLSSEAANEQTWAVVALHMEVFIGATAEEMRFFAIIDPTFR
jgi:para-nitrobenzyl esterase